MNLLKEIEHDINEIGIIYHARFCYSEFAEFRALLTKLKSLAVKCGLEIINGHYDLCAWSNKNRLFGPDTCLCTVANLTYCELKKNYTHPTKVVGKIIFLKMDSPIALKSIVLYTILCYTDQSWLENARRRTATVHVSYVPVVLESKIFVSRT